MHKKHCSIRNHANHGEVACCLSLRPPFASSHPRRNGSKVFHGKEKLELVENGLVKESKKRWRGRKGREAGIFLGFSEWKQLGWFSSYGATVLLLSKENAGFFSFFIIFFLSLSTQKRFHEFVKSRGKIVKKRAEIHLCVAKVLKGWDVEIQIFRGSHVRKFLSFFFI